MITKSPSAAARSTSIRVPKRSRRACDLLLDVVVGDREVLDLRLEGVVRGQLDLGLTSTSAVNSRASPSSSVVTSISGWASGSRSFSCIASMYGGSDVVDGLVEDGATAELTVDHERQGPCRCGSRGR